MALANIRPDHGPLQTPASAPPLTTGRETFDPAPSPARALQQQLAQHAQSANGTDQNKWSPRSSVALIVSASVALWFAILMAGAQAAKLIV